MLRCAGYGTGVGVLTAFVVTTTLVLAAGISAEGAAVGSAQALAAVPFFLVFGGAIGAGLGLACGVVAGLVVLVAGEADRNWYPSPAGHRVLRVRTAYAAVWAGAGAALLPGIAAAVEWASHSNGWGIAWFGVANLALAAGAALGPRIMYGPGWAGKQQNPGPSGPRLGR
jgi:hypothetical protein